MVGACAAVYCDARRSADRGARYSKRTRSGSFAAALSGVVLTPARIMFMAPGAPEPTGALVGGLLRRGRLAGVHRSWGGGLIGGPNASQTTDQERGQQYTPLAA